MSKVFLISKEDKSANSMVDGVESRYVQRRDDYFIIYLSSFNGCDQACRFCHLTQTKQVDMRAEGLEGFTDQAIRVLEHWKEHHSQDVGKLKKIHVNFMARGEPLLNYWLTLGLTSLLYNLRYVIKQYTGVEDIRFKISTIMPGDSRIDGIRFNEEDSVEYYYSLYSMKEEFRKRWLPKALNPKVALHLLRGKNVTIHHALIKGENDSLEDAELIASTISKSPHTPKFNLVRYNPYSPLQGEEPDEETILKYLDFMRESEVFSRVKMIPRVGQDVKASCGTFLQG